jgi:hypothetical protein
MARGRADAIRRLTVFLRRSHVVTPYSKFLDRSNGNPKNAMNEPNLVGMTPRSTRLPRL